MLTKYLHADAFKGDQYVDNLHFEIMKAIKKARQTADIGQDTRASDFTALAVCVAILTQECKDRNEFSLMTFGDIAGMVAVEIGDHPEWLLTLRNYS